MTSTVTTLKRCFETVLVLSLIGDCIPDLCAKVHGPYFRCVISDNCRSKDLSSSPKKCGPGKVGICCRIISNISPPRCGIRYPGIVDDNFKVRSQFRHEEENIYEKSSVSESPEMSSDTTFLTQETSLLTNLTQVKDTPSGIISRKKREFNWNCSAEDFTSTGGPKTTPLLEDESDDLDLRNKVFNPQFIIGGRIEEQSWPWVVAIYYEPTGKFICAGTLFDDRHIISAAHCFARNKYHDPSCLVVTIGYLKRTDMATKESNPDKVQLYKVKRIFQHEGFLPNCFCNDVSILRLASPVGPDVIPACIAQKMPARAGQTVTAMGWGQTEYGSNNSKGIRGTYQLQRIDDLIIFNSKRCKKILSKVSGFRMPKKFADYYICAGVPSGEKDACVGDSGGPLMFEDYDGYWSLVGVVSFGYKCGVPGIPATYSKISYYLPWILNVTKTV